MIPILYPKTETTFTSNGLGRLAECVSCRVTEERNGSYECEFSYPITGKHYADIDEGCYIACTHDDDGGIEPFEIYRRSAPINGIVTFNARHLSYRLSFVILNPFSATNIADALTGFTTSNINTNPFAFWTDKATYAPFSVDRPASVRSVMGGVEGSILDAYGGEWEFVKWTVKLWASRGTNSGVTIRYGKNLRNLEQTVDAGDAFNSVVPYWSKEEEDQTILVTLPEKIVSAAGVIDPVPVALDLSADFLEQPTEAELRTAALDYLDKHTPWIPNENIKIDFIQLWQTTEYKDVANLQKVRLCDTVNVYYPALGVTLNDVKVIKVVYNVLADRYDEMELGQPSATFADTIAANLSKQITKSQQVMEGFFDAAITTATELLSGNQGGHVVIKYDINGKPQQILIMDTEDELTATNILRINLNGIGFSTDGGVTYSTAWTIDGRFVADFITTGTLRAIMIQGPTADTFWNLTSGEWQSYGEKPVTSDIETAEGTHTTTTYTVAVTTNINEGELTVNGTIKNSGDDPIEYADFGVDANSLDYEFYEHIPDDIPSASLSYPYAGIDLRGGKISSYAGNGDMQPLEDLDTVNYSPAAHMGPDFIEIGLPENVEDSGGDPYSGGTVDRNTLRLSGGWVEERESIMFLKRVDVYADLGGSGNVRRFHDPPVRVRPAWEYTDGETINVQRFNIAATITNNKQDIRFTLPLTRPISEDITYIDPLITITRAWQNGTAIISSSQDIHYGSSYADVADYYITEAGLNIWIRAVNADWSAATNNSVILLQGSAWINVYNEDPNA